MRRFWTLYLLTVPQHSANYKPRQPLTTHTALRLTPLQSWKHAAHAGTAESSLPCHRAAHLRITRVDGVMRWTRCARPSASRRTAAAPSRAVALTSGANAEVEGLLLLAPGCPAAPTALHLNLLELVVEAVVVLEAIVELWVALTRHLHNGHRAAAAAAAQEDAQEQEDGYAHLRRCSACLHGGGGGGGGSDGWVGGWVTARQGAGGLTPRAKTGCLMICSSSASTCSSAMPSSSLRVSVAAMMVGRGAGR